LSSLRRGLAPMPNFIGATFVGATSFMTVQPGGCLFCERMGESRPWEAADDQSIRADSTGEGKPGGRCEAGVSLPLASRSHDGVVHRGGFAGGALSPLQAEVSGGRAPAPFQGVVTIRNRR
jgi:hypothetical protein